MSNFINLDDFMNVEAADIATIKPDEVAFYKPNPTGTPTKTYKSIIRFLPNPKEAMRLENMAIEQKKYWLESEGGKGYFLCPSMIGEKSVIADTWRRLNASKNPIEVELAKKINRQIKYYSLVLVVKDFVNSNNEGKIFVFQYGKKIYDKLKTLITPSREDVEMGSSAANPFDLAKGRNLFINAKMVGQFPNYDDSSFDSEIKPISFDPKGTKNILNDKETKEKFAALFNECPDLNEFRYKPWTEEETERCHKILAVLTGQESVRTEKATNSVNSIETEESQEGDDVLDNWVKEM